MGSIVFECSEAHAWPKQENPVDPGSGIGELLYLWKKAKNLMAMWLYTALAAWV